MKIKILDPSDLVLEALHNPEAAGAAPNAETLAMLQALYSRSPKSVDQHLEKVFAEGASSFMETYYVGYGHSSIGQCASITIFIEGVSFLAAKAVQSDSYYNGQEASTRYMDFSNASWTAPKWTEESDWYMNSIFKDWLVLYERAYKDVFMKLQAENPKPEDVSQEVYMRTLKAASFDVARGFLPCGLHTNLSWHGTLDGIRKHLKALANHPLQEVKELVSEIYALLRIKYTSSFPETLLKHGSEEFYYRQLGDTGFNLNVPANHKDFSLYVTDKNEPSYELFVIAQSRPPNTRLPKALDSAYDVHCRFALDFASFRDFQRHRQGVTPIPVVSSQAGFHPWYLQQLSGEVSIEVLCEVQRLLMGIKALQEEGMSEFEIQNLLPMGMLVEVETTISLPQAVYIAELRSNQSVHPTLRTIAQKMGKSLQSVFSELPLYVDYEESKLSFKRGTQTIEEKK